MPTLVLAWLALGAILERTGGIPVAPLDDSYIHFQFACSFARAAPLEYVPGAGAVPGATSLLWPMILAVPYAIGLRADAIVWAAWALGFTALGLLAHEARLTARRLAGPVCSAGAALLVLAFGANLWFAASGMEVIPLAWLMLRGVRRAAEWWEGEAEPFSPEARRRELILIAALLPLIRPEGAFVSLLIGVTLVVVPRGGSRALGLLPLGLMLLPALVNASLTGSATSTTMHAKWLVFNPYTTLSSLAHALAWYAELLVGTLLNGREHSALFLPEGSAPFFLASLVALPVVGVRKKARARSALLVLLALGILLPGTYECALCNRLRYLWPFLPAWMVGAAALASLVEEGVARRAGVAGAGPLFIGALGGGLLAHLADSIEDLATSARAISDQQVTLGRWAQRELSPGSSIGVNDTGAIGYFSEHPIFDIVGLTTAGEARYWTAGAGSRLEHYEKLPRKRLPDTFIVYPEWFAIDALLGQELVARFVPDATILGGQRMAAYRADYSLLGTGEDPEPELCQGREVVDRLDVADLESEAAHDYALFDARKADDIAIAWNGRLDGARAERARDEFELELRPRGALLLRLSTGQKTRLVVEIGHRIEHLTVPAAPWHSARLDLPAGTPRGRVRLAVSGLGARFASLHYFSLGPKP